jgi:hypothetical protein
VDEEAFKVNGDVTVVLLAGLLTVTPARAGNVIVKARTEARVKLRAEFIEFPLRLHIFARPQIARSSGKPNGLHL